MARKLFVNLAVKDLNKSVEFFTRLGFKFDPKFTDEKATCLIIGDDSYAMLLVEKFFKSFLVDDEICVTAKSREVLNAISLESRQEVDEMLRVALEAGATEYRSAQDYGWMYGRSFKDLDGHVWEFFYMDESARPNGQ